MSSLEQFTKMPVGKKIGILVGFALLLGAAFWFGYYGDLLEDYEKEVKKQKTIRKKLKNAELKKHQLDKDRLVRDNLRKESADFGQMLPAETDMSSFLESLHTQAELVGLEIVSVFPESEEPSPYYARIPVKISIRGGYHQIAKFFYQIGKLDRIINIENINLAVSSMDESGVVLKATALATTFRSMLPPAGDNKKKAQSK